MAKDDIVKHQFEKGVSGNPNGRPLKIYTILKKSGYSKDDIRAAFSEIPWSTDEELKAIYEDPSKPVIVKAIAHSLKKARDKGDYRYIKDIMEQIMGSPKQDIDQQVDSKLEIIITRASDAIPPRAE